MTPGAHCRRTPGRMNAWCIGARRRPTHGGGGDADGGGDGTATASGERESGAGTTGAGQRVNHQHHGHPPSERDHKRELELKRGTRRARVCIGAVVRRFARARERKAVLCALYRCVRGRERERDGGLGRQPSAPPPPPPPPAASARREEEANRRAKVWIPVRVARARID